MSNRLPFIKTMHPKADIRFSEESISNIINQGWIAQLKIHGHRAQIHLPMDSAAPPTAYNRHGSEHKKKLPDFMIKELMRVFSPLSGDLCIEVEWVKQKDLIYIFDCIKHNGKILYDKTYEQRMALIPKSFISPNIKVLPILKTPEECLSAAAEQNPLVEGLVFKSLETKGFHDSAIIRCRKNK